MTLKDRLILIADISYRFRQVDGSDGATYDASKTLKFGKALDAEIKGLHDKLKMPYTKTPGRFPKEKCGIFRLQNRKKERFHLQATKSFPDGAPQRENYDHDDDCFRAEAKYSAEWRKEFECPGCTDVCCPQCGRS
jgi:hypothetical protein